MNELDNLRNEVESVESFKTVFQGYDKKRVNEVFSELTSSNRELEQRNEELLSENESLKKDCVSFRRNLRTEKRTMPRLKAAPRSFPAFVLLRRSLTKK